MEISSDLIHKITESSQGRFSEQHYVEVYHETHGVKEFSIVGYEYRTVINQNAVIYEHSNGRCSRYYKGLFITKEEWDSPRFQIKLIMES